MDLHAIAGTAYVAPASKMALRATIYLTQSQEGDNTMDQFKFRNIAPASADDTAGLVELAETRAQLVDMSRSVDPLGPLSYDETFEIAQLLAPSCGIEGCDIGSGG